ncbi:hypothetical protein D3C85_1076760 [compost metagenome]
MAIYKLAFQEVQKLRSGMGKGRKFFTGIVHGNHVGLEAFFRPASMVEQVIRMSFLGSSTYDLQSFITFDEQRTATRLVVLAKQLGHWHAQHVA